MDANLFAELLESVEEMNAIRRGEKTGKVTTAADLGLTEPSQIRKHLGLSQSKFSALMGVSVRTLEGWEQKRRQPTGAARMLLLIAARRPDAIIEVLKAEAITAKMMKRSSRKKAVAA